MGDKTGIEWTDATWTPLRARNVETGKIGWHCEHKSAACRNCYAEGINLRLGTKLPFKPGHLVNGDVESFLDERLLTQPLRWQRPREIFVCSMTDLFALFVRRAWIVKVFAVMAYAQHHDFQVLTKRPDRMAELTNDPAFVEEVEQALRDLTPPKRLPRTLEDVGGWPLENVMLGGSAGDQHEANEVVRHVLEANAAWRFLSYEPALGPLDLTMIAGFGDGVYRDALIGSDWRLVDGERIYVGSCYPTRKLSLVIAGGESGRMARPAHPNWFRAVRDQCAMAGVAFFFKQWGEWDADALLNTDVATGACPPPKMRVGKKAAGALLDGRLHQDWPGRRQR